MTTGVSSQRSRAAETAIVVGATVQVANRALSVGRIAAATPLAWKNGKMPLWAFELAVQKSTIDIVPASGGRWNAWGKAFATSQALKGVGALATLSVAGTSTLGALREGGPDALISSKQGRTGLAASAASVATLGFMGLAAAHGRSGGAAGMARSMFTDPMLGRWLVVGPSLAAWTVIGANELGYLDVLNKGERRDASTIVSDANQHAAGLMHKWTPF